MMGKLLIILRPHIFIIVLIITSISSTALSYDEISTSKKKIVKPEEITRIIFHVYQKPKEMDAYRYDGYLIFFNSYNETCAFTSSNKIYIWSGKGDKPNPAGKGFYDYYREIQVMPSSFKVMNIAGRGTVIGIPIGTINVRYKNEFSATYSEKKEPPIMKFYWEQDRTGYVRMEKVRPYKTL